ncbi:hypothetical protein ACSBR2_030704 [Camellia fascicularis]
MKCLWVLLSVTISAMAAFPSFDLVIHYKGKVGRVYNVDPDMYCHVDLLKDVHDSVLSNIGLIKALAIHLYCDIPGTDKRRMLENDLDVLDMFYMQSVSRIINLYVDVVYSIGCEGEEVNAGDEVAVEIDQSVHDGDGDVDGDDEYHMDDFVGFSDEDLDWNENVDAENESDSTSSEYVLSQDDGLGEDDGTLSDYQSGDDVMVYDVSTDDDLDDEPICRPKRRDFNGKQFHTPYDDKEPYLNPKGEVVLEKGMIFTDVNNFRASLKDCIVETGFKIVRDKNEKSRVTAYYATEGCPWRIHVSPLPDGITYKIKTLVPQHTCSRLNQNTKATSDWIAKKLAGSFKENPDMGLDTMQGKLNKMYGIDALKMQLYRAKNICRDEVEGNHGSQYMLLPTYVAEIKKTNLGSFVKINYDNPPKPISEDEPTPKKESTISSNPVFKRIFISFEAMKIGFVNGCRRFIGVDGCHLKGPYGGVLISAVGLDGNNGLFPLEVGVVECECKESLTFFLQHLRTILSDALHTRLWTIMSDLQKSLDTIVTEILPEANHRRCCMHLFNNFRGKFPGMILRKNFWKVARA